MLYELVKRIIDEVKEHGDHAILRYNIQFDKNSAKVFLVSEAEKRMAHAHVNGQIVNAINLAIQNISVFSIAQLRQLKDFSLRTDYGTLSQIITPIETVGCYVPGGRFPLLSSALMSVVPAKIAGVKEIIVCSPNIQPEVIVAADIAGATKIYDIGGVQAIAAMAYGSKKVPRVDKIVGPGNKYVTMAKKIVYGDVGIDFLAGPSEVMIIADETADDKLMNADMEAQKEHDPDAKVWCIRVSSRIEHQIKNAIKSANEIAPEHLELLVKNPERYVPELKNYGSLFIGKYSAVAFGDYCSGTNHILPTGGASRYTGGLSVLDFVKVQTSQRITGKGAKILSKAALPLAGVEGLVKHAESIKLRAK